MMLAVENIHTTVTQASEEETSWLREYLSFKDSSAFFKNRGRRGGKPVSDRVHLFNLWSSSFPTGLLSLVTKAAPGEGFAVSVVDRRGPAVARDTNADLGWLRDYQRTAVDEVVRNERGILWMPTGCLAGDTKLVVNRGGAVRPYELRTVVKRLAGEATANRAGRLCAWDLSTPTFTQSVDDEGFVRKNRIERGWSNGTAEVFEVVTSAGRVLRATKDHRFLTPGGYARLHELRGGDTASVVVWPASLAPRRRQEYVQQGHMFAHPFAQITNATRDGRTARVPLHRLVAEARANGVSLAELVGRLMLGEVDGLTFLDPEVWHVHHADGNARNNAAGNLEVLGAREHLAKHGREEGWKHVAGRIAPEKIRSITRVGEEETYDLQMADPMHNYVANEVVVHNSGKTEVAAALTLALPVTWLFLVHRAGLVDQAARRYELRTKMRATVIAEGKTTRGDGALICATFQSIAAGVKKKDPETIRLLSSAGGLMVDEAHVLPAGTFYNIALLTPSARFRVGLSGTPLARGDNRSTMAIAALGPVIYRIRTDLLIDRGVLARPTIRMVQVNERSEKPTWQGVYGESIVRSPYRNKHVLEACRRAEKPGLLFVKEVAHGKFLTKMLQKAGLQADFVWGNHSTDMRNARVRDLVKGKLDILVCSVVFQEGIDIPELRSAVFASGGKSVIAALQRLGRGMRVERNAAGVATKTTFEAWDIADNGCGCTGAGKDAHQGCKWLEKHTRERVKAYTAEGHKVLRETFAIAPARGA